MEICWCTHSTQNMRIFVVWCKLRANGGKQALELRQRKKNSYDIFFDEHTLHVHGTTVFMLLARYASQASFNIIFFPSQHLETICCWNECLTCAFSLSECVYKFHVVVYVMPYNRRCVLRLRAVRALNMDGGLFLVSFIVCTICFSWMCVCVCCVCVWEARFQRWTSRRDRVRVGESFGFGALEVQSIPINKW